MRRPECTNRHTAVVEDEEDEEATVEHQLEQVQQVLCDLSQDLRPQDLVSRKVLAIDTMWKTFICNTRLQMRK
jgi:hypothetical protein